MFCQTVLTARWVVAAGLTKVPIDGQPKSIVRELEDMARSYIKAWAQYCPLQAWYVRG